MSRPALSTKTALVIGASRGFGRAIASALHAHVGKVVGVARSIDQLGSLHQELGDGFIGIAGDVCDSELA